MPAPFDLAHPETRVKDKGRLLSFTNDPVNQTLVVVIQRGYLSGGVGPFVELDSVTFTADYSGGFATPEEAGVDFLVTLPAPSDSAVILAAIASAGLV